jgi:hypothetical protein
MTTPNLRRSGKERLLSEAIYPEQRLALAGPTSTAASISTSKASMFSSLAYEAPMIEPAPFCEVSDVEIAAGRILTAGVWQPSWRQKMRNFDPN